jgi:hypothetical protein
MIHVQVSECTHHHVGVCDLKFKTGDRLMAVQRLLSICLITRGHSSQLRRPPALGSNPQIWNYDGSQPGSVVGRLRQAPIVVS